MPSNATRSKRHRWREVEELLAAAGLDPDRDRLYSETDSRLWIPYGIELGTMPNGWTRRGRAGLRRFGERDLQEREEQGEITIGEAARQRLTALVKVRDELTREELEKWLAVPDRPGKGGRMTAAEARWWSHPRRGRFVDQKPGLLREFCRLGEAPEAQILRFARRRGLLLLCHHGLPCNHAPHPFQPGPSDDCRPLPFEPLSAWRALARSFAAILEVNAHLRGLTEDVRLSRRWSGDPHPAPQEKWDGVSRYFLPRLAVRWELEGGPQRVVDTLAGQRLWLGWAVDQWLQLANIRLRFQWETRWTEHGDVDAIDLPHASYGLFPRLVSELAFAVAKRPQLEWCHWGTHFFPPKRRLPKGRFHCCGRKRCLRTRSREQAAGSRSRARQPQPRRTNASRRSRRKRKADEKP